MKIWFTRRRTVYFLLACLALLDVARARAGQFWQLTFTYSDNGLALNQVQAQGRHLPSNRSAELLLGPLEYSKFAPSGSSALRSLVHGS